MRRRTALLACLVLALGGTACAVDEAMPIPYCDREGSGLVVAQSVPGAELVPCLDPPPTGWQVTRVHVDQSGTRVHLDSDRAGEGAAVLRFAADCDRGEAVPVPTDIQDTERFEFIETVDPAFRAQRYYTFPGGCISWEFDFDRTASAALSIELGGSLRIIARDVINENVARDFVDEEL